MTKYPQSKLYTVPVYDFLSLLIAYRKNRSTSSK